MTLMKADLRNDVVVSLLATVAMAAVMTLGDFVWAYWRLPHTVSIGLIHGAAVCLLLGLVLGVIAGGNRSALCGAIGGTMLGLIASGSFYLMFLTIGMPAMFVAWMGLWLMMSLFYGWISNTSETIGLTCARGLMAAVLSGLAFYAISGIWLGFDPTSSGYVVHFVSWVAAFLPGFLALLVANSDDV